MTKRVWVVHTQRQEHIKITAEGVEVRDNGTLIFFDGARVILHAFPSGAWVEVKETRDEDLAWRT